MDLNPVRDKEPLLIEAARNGERAAFDNLVALYRQKGLGIAYNLTGNFEDAKDVLQEAFIKVYLNLKGFREKAKFSTWFYRIVVNCGLDFLRRRKTASRVFIGRPLLDEEGNEKETADQRYDPAKLTLNQELREKLDEKIAGLPGKQRLAFTLKHQNGLSNQEIAEVLGCGIATVKVHLFRAARRLQEELSGYVV